MKSRVAQVVVACLAIAFLLPLFYKQFWPIGNASWFWLAVMATGAAIFAVMWLRAKARGEDLREVFAHLPTASEQVEFAPEPKIED